VILHVKLVAPAFETHSKWHSFVVCSAKISGMVVFFNFIIIIIFKGQCLVLLALLSHLSLCEDYCRVLFSLLL